MSRADVLSRVCSAVGSGKVGEADASILKPGDVVYLTKHAVTAGIERRVVDSVKGRYVYLKSPSFSQQVIVDDVFASEEKAQQDAQDKIAGRIASLERQLTKLQKKLGKPVKVRDEAGR